MSIIDLSVADTEPGASGPFSPPDNILSEDDYAYWLRERYANDPGFAQVMAIVSRRQARRSTAHPPDYRGRFSKVLKKELELLDRHLRQQQP